MRKKQPIKTIVHMPEAAVAVRLQGWFNGFYLEQVEVQMQSYGLSSAQNADVFAALAAEYGVGE